MCFWEIGTYRHKTRDVNGKSRYTRVRSVGKHDGAVHSPELHQPTSALDRWTENTHSLLLDEEKRFGFEITMYFANR